MNTMERSPDEAHSGRQSREIAVRIIHACHDLGLEAVAVYADDDADALFVQLADEAIPCMG